MGKIVGVLGLALVAFVCEGAWGAAWYVDGSVWKPGDGSSWETALKTIQSGIEKAVDGDTVIVAKGTYVENVNFNGKNITLCSTYPTDWTVVKETVIDGNQAGSVLTLAGTEDETCVLSGFTIRNGTGTFYGSDSFCGGGIFGTLDLATMPRVTIQNNIITGNSAENGGGIFGCAGVIEKCIIAGNSAGNQSPNWVGGGIAFSNGIIQNNLIVGNSAGGCGGALSFCNADFRNNVVVGNAAPGDHGGGLAHLGTSSWTPPGGSLTNCIIWGNTSPSGAQVHDSVAPSHCCIQDWTGGGEGNIVGDPRFVDGENGDYRLLGSSGCIDRGTNEDWMQGAVDLDGNPRILVGATSLTVDIGAYEHKFSVATLSWGGAGGAELTWYVRPGRTYTVWSCLDPVVEPWTDEATIVPDKGQVLAIWSDMDAAPTGKFYRVELK